MLDPQESGEILPGSLLCPKAGTCRSDGHLIAEPSFSPLAATVYGIYKQNVNDDSPSSLVVGLRDSPLQAAVTPDGKRVVYMQRRVGSNPQIMRVALTGGRPETLDTHEEVLSIGCSRGR